MAQSPPLGRKRDDLPAIGARGNEPMMKIVYAPSRRNASRRTMSDGTVAVGNRPREMTRRRCSSCPSLRTPGGKTALTESRNNSRPDLLDMPQCLLSGRPESSPLSLGQGSRVRIHRSDDQNQSLSPHAVIERLSSFPSVSSLLDSILLTAVGGAALPFVGKPLPSRRAYVSV